MAGEKGLIGRLKGIECPLCLSPLQASMAPTVISHFQARPKPAFTKPVSSSRAADGETSSGRGFGLAPFLGWSWAFGARIAFFGPRAHNPLDSSSGHTRCMLGGLVLLVAVGGSCPTSALAAHPPQRARRPWVPAAASGPGCPASTASMPSQRAPSSRTTWCLRCAHVSLPSACRGSQGKAALLAAGPLGGGTRPATAVPLSCFARCLPRPGGALSSLRGTPPPFLIAERAAAGRPPRADRGGVVARAPAGHCQRAAGAAPAPDQEQDRIRRWDRDGRSQRGGGRPAASKVPADQVTRGRGPRGAPPACHLGGRQAGPLARAQQATPGEPRSIQATPRVDMGSPIVRLIVLQVSYGTGPETATGAAAPSIANPNSGGSGSRDPNSTQEPALDRYGGSPLRTKLG